MIPQVEELLHSPKAMLFLESVDKRTIDNVLSDLGFQDGRKDVPHHGEIVRVVPISRSPLNMNPIESGTIFEAAYILMVECYSNIEDCPVPLEVATRLYENGLRVAVHDSKSITGCYLVREI